MNHLFIAFALSLMPVTYSFGRFQDNYSKYFKRVPLNEAHIIYGDSQERFFNPESIKVLVWNIKKTQEIGWESEFLKYGRNRDLFLIQEAFPNNLFHSTLQKFSGIRWDFGVSFKYVMHNLLPTGTMIGSKVEPTKTSVKHTADLEPLTETPKSMTLGKYPLSQDKELLVISVHGINFSNFDSFKRNMNQIEEEILMHNGPVLVAGDFNTRTLARTQYLFSLMKRQGLNEVKFQNSEMRMKAHMTNYFLDFGFVRGMEVKDAKVIGNVVGSDHKPMLLEVSVKDK